MIVILVYGPDFAASENLTKAFALMDETQLISLHPTDWRKYDEGLLISPQTIDRAGELVTKADLIFLGDSLAFETLATVSPEVDWVKFARSKRTVGYFGDSFYFYKSRYYDGLCEATEMQPLFLLPNLIPLANIDAIPLHHPMEMMNAAKPERVTIMHAPGTPKKSRQKGTEAIERVVCLLEQDYEFDYQRLMNLTAAECKEVKAQAHIVIDQLPPNGMVQGLGRTGIEALAAGSVVLTTMYPTDILAGYFEPPPVLNVRNETELEQQLRQLLEQPELRQEYQQKSAAWAAANVELGAWGKYVGKWV